MRAKLAPDLALKVQRIAEAFDNSNIEGAVDGISRRTGMRRLNALARELATVRQRADDLMRATVQTRSWFAGAAK